MQHIGSGGVKLENAFDDKFVNIVTDDGIQALGIFDVLPGFESPNRSHQILQSIN